MPVKVSKDGNGADVVGIVSEGALEGVLVLPSG